MNGVPAEVSLATDVLTPTAVISSTAAQNEISVSDDEVWCHFFLQI